MSFGLWSGVVATPEGGKGEGWDAAPQGAQSPTLRLHLPGVFQGKGLPQLVLQRGKPELRVLSWLLSPSPCKAVEPNVVEEGMEQGLGAVGSVGQGWWEQHWEIGEGAAAMSQLSINLLSHCLFKSIMNGICH